MLPVFETTPSTSPTRMPVAVPLALEERLDAKTSSEALIVPEFEI